MRRDLNASIIISILWLDSMNLSYGTAGDSKWIN